MLNTIWQWLIKSSADPKKYSATVKFALLGVIPYVLSIATAACGLGLVCLGVTSEGLNEVVAWIANALEAVLNLVALAGVLYGAGRKFWLTFKGRNQVLNVIKSEAEKREDWGVEGEEVEGTASTSDSEEPVDEEPKNEVQ